MEKKAKKVTVPKVVINPKKEIIEKFFAKWEIPQGQKLYLNFPKTPEFKKEFKKVFEGNVTKQTKGGVFPVPARLEGCNNCIGEHLKLLDLYYNKL